MHLIRVRTAIGVLCCLLQVALAQAGINAWTTSGPPGGTYRDMEVSSTNSDLYYAVYTRTFFRSTDAAVTWQATRDFAAEAVEIAADPTDGNRLYVAALSDGLYRSEDGGQTFTKIAASTDMIWAVGAGGADGQTVYYATNSGAFWQSKDRGHTWTQRTSTPQTISDILVDNSSGESILAIRGDALRRSSDGGQTWTESYIGGAGSYIYSLARAGTGKVVAATQSGIYVSPDDGATWTLDFPGFYWCAVPDPAVPGALVAAGAGPGLLRRPSEGATWSSFGASPQLGASRRVIVGGGTPSRLVVANGQGVMRSTDNGVTWVESALGPTASSPVTKMAATAGVNARVFAYVMDGLFSTSLDSGWQRQNLRNAEMLVGQSSFGQAAIAVKPSSPQTVYLGTFGQGMFRSNDGGSTWTGPGTGLQTLAPYTIAFDPVNPNIMYTNVFSTLADPAVAGLYWSTDGGMSWMPRSVDLPAVVGVRLVVDPADGSRMFLAVPQGFSAAGTGGLYRSVDGGIHWTQSFVGTDVHDVAVDPSDSHRIYAATALGLQVSTDGGASFAPNTSLAIITTLPVSAVAVDPLIPTTIYAASVDPNAGLNLHQDISSTILRSVDRGQTWEVLRANTDTPAWFVGDLMLDPLKPSLIYASTGVRGISAYEIQNDLSLSLTGHSGARSVGEPSSFDLRAENHGALSATGVHLNIQLPAGLTGVAATPNVGTCGLSGTVLLCDVPLMAPAAALTVHVTYTPPAAMPLPVSAMISAQEQDNVAANNSVTASATAGEVVDLRVTVVPSLTTLNTGSSLNYTVQATNAGPTNSSAATLAFGLASGVSLGTPLPTGCSATGSQVSCTLGALAAGDSQSFSFSATANTAGDNVATVSIAAASTASDIDVSNNTAQATVTVTTPAPPTNSGGSTGSSSGGGGGGGGGSIGYATLLFSLLMVVARAGRILSCPEGFWGGSRAAGSWCPNHGTVTVRQHPARDLERLRFVL